MSSIFNSNSDYRSTGSQTTKLNNELALVLINSDIQTVSKINVIMSENTNFNTNEDLREICQPIEGPIDQPLNYIYFVTEEHVSDLMAQAFQLCDADPRVYNQWIESKDLHNWYQLRDKLFVINCFAGNSFNYLNKRNARIIGPLVVLSAYFNHSINSLFKTNHFKFNPIINKCMEDSFVCIRVRDQKKCNHLIKLIELMSGIYCHQMCSVVTHLVIDSIKTRLHRKALNFGVRVVTEEWVFKCWHHSKDTIFNGNEESIVEQFLVPLFKKVPINKEIVLIEDNTQSEKSIENIDNNISLKCEPIDWIDFECESKCESIEELCEEKEVKESDGQALNSVDFIDVKSEEKEENPNITIDKNDEFNDGLDWIYFECPKNEVLDSHVVSHAINDEIDDGLNWIYFECPKNEVLDSHVVTHTINDEINDKVIIPMKGSKMKRKNTEINVQKYKKSFKPNQRLSEVVWNFQEFSQIPSQIPYYRI